MSNDKPTLKKKGKSSPGTRKRGKAINVLAPGLGRRGTALLCGGRMEGTGQGGDQGKIHDA